MERYEVQKHLEYSNWATRFKSNTLSDQKYLKGYRKKFQFRIVKIMSEIEPVLYMSNRNIRKVNTVLGCFTWCNI
jgi:hypothetical protein